MRGAVPLHCKNYQMIKMSTSITHHTKILSDFFFHILSFVTISLLQYMYELIVHQPLYAGLNSPFASSFWFSSFLMWLFGCHAGWQQSAGSIHPHILWWAGNSSNDDLQSNEIKSCTYSPKTVSYNKLWGARPSYLQDGPEHAGSDALSLLLHQAATDRPERALDKARPLCTFSLFTDQHTLTWETHRSLHHK